VACERSPQRSALHRRPAHDARRRTSDQRDRPQLGYQVPPARTRQLEPGSSYCSPWRQARVELRENRMDVAGQAAQGFSRHDAVVVSMHRPLRGYVATFGKGLKVRKVLSFLGRRHPYLSARATSLRLIREECECVAAKLLKKNRQLS